MFSHYADAREGTLSHANFALLLRDCDISPSAGFVTQSLQSAFTPTGASPMDVTTITMFYPELLDVFGRMADAATPSPDLASGLSAFLHNAWSSFTQRVPQAMQIAADIAASHQAAAANATGEGGVGGSKMNTPRDTRVKFA
jgi:hypothetical protein